ncbi:MAG: hypothetical protein ACKOCD_09905, partial [Nitrospiraceae bacterium]
SRESLTIRRFKIKPLGKGYRSGGGFCSSSDAFVSQLTASASGLPRVDEARAVYRGLFVWHGSCS